MADLRDVDMSDAPELSAGRQAIPPADYMLFMEDSVIKENNNGKKKLECVFVVATGEHEGARIMHWFDFWDTSPDKNGVPKNGRHKAAFKALCEAVLGLPYAINNESASLHQKLFIGKVDNVPFRVKNDQGVWVADESRRGNELVFQKGTIRPSNPPKTETAQNTVGGGQQAHTAPQANTNPAQTAPQAQAQTAQQAPTVTPGKGPRPWDKK